MTGAVARVEAPRLRPSTLVTPGQRLGRVLPVLRGVLGSRGAHLSADVSLGLVNGIEYVLWCYTFATMIFTGALMAYLPLGASVILVGCATLMITVGLTSRVHVHVAGTEEQAVALLATIGILMNTRMGEFASPDAAAATMFAVMGLSSVAFGICLYLAGRFNLDQLVQLTPYPVVCGYLAGIGWLFFAAAVTLLTGSELHPSPRVPCWSRRR